MKKALGIFDFLRKRQAQGERVALITLTGVDGSAARVPGTHMAVAGNGDALGSFSGGCIEAAVIAEALQVIADGVARTVRFGAGSPYIDIRLPCGGGIDLLFVPDPAPEQIAAACELLGKRWPVLLDQSPTGALQVRPAISTDETGWQADRFLVRHDPMLRLIIAGHGAEPAALIRSAQAYGADLLLLSPEDSTLQEAADLGVPAVELRTVGPSDALTVDPWTALILLFHDHDWETALLAQALATPALFVGAMGSRRTHEERRSRLLESGVDAASIARIVGPVGMIDGARDPETLAVSIMAQLVSYYENRLSVPGLSHPQDAIEVSSGADPDRSAFMQSCHGAALVSDPVQDFDCEKEEPVYARR